MINIREMTAEDIGIAHNFTEIENWGYLKEDFLKLLSFQPNGCFIAELELVPVGIVTTTAYDHFGFIGTLIVNQIYRNKKIGEQLMRQAIKYLETLSVKTIGLDGVIPAVPLYRRLRFKDHYLSLRFLREPRSANGSTDKKIAEADENIISYDREMTGLNRERLIRPYLDEIPDNIFCYHDDSIKGYAMVRPRSGGYFMIAPLVANNVGIAQKLLDHILSKFENERLGIGVPMFHNQFAKYLIDKKFGYKQPSLRMYRGEAVEYEHNQYGIFSAEKG